jgi:hypothetical protein
MANGRTNFALRLIFVGGLRSHAPPDANKPFDEPHHFKSL